MEVSEGGKGPVKEKCENAIKPCQLGKIGGGEGQATPIQRTRRDRSVTLKNKKWKKK